MERRTPTYPEAVPPAPTNRHSLERCPPDEGVRGTTIGIYALTVDPIFSPSTTRRMLPC